jgi:uridine kinase
MIEKKMMKGSCLLDLVSEADRKVYVCARVNGIIRELSYVFPEDTQAKIEFLDLTNLDAARLYSASLRYLTCLAIYNIDPKLQVRFFCNISRSIFVRVTGGKNFHVTPDFVKTVEEEMEDIVQADIPFQRVKIAKEDALATYRKEGLTDKISVLRYRKENFVHVYKACYSGSEYYDYFYGQMVPSSGFLTQFGLRFYAPGMILQVPRSDCQGKIPEFSDEIKFALTLATTSKWAEDNSLDTVSNINRFIKEYGPLALINVSETRINDLLGDLGNRIVTSVEPVRCVLVAGPSSSGKTSFANRLLFELMSKGLRPIRISIDDFYIPRDILKPGTDLESVDALDVPFFNKVITDLVSGEEVSLPTYDFKSGNRLFQKPIRLEDSQPMIIEGIHALNPLLTEAILTVQKYRIYIAPQPQVNLDYHTPMSMTDMRLLRRIARDSRTRNSSASDTIRMWPNVRGGEFKYIYPTQENADYVFDSFMHYELSALRNIVLPLLEKVAPEEPEYQTARRLMQMVRYFLPIPIEDIPCNSLMREFVGGTSFKDAR